MEYIRKEPTLEEALKQIEQLQKENAYLRKELEQARKRKISGRKRHDEKWMNAYNDFVACYESGMRVSEIAKKQCVSSRTIYRFREHYLELQKKDMGTMKGEACNV